MKNIFRPDLLDGKVAIITGGSRGGIMKEIARQFMLHGASVSMMSRNKEKNDEVAADLNQELKSICKYAQNICLSVAGDVRKPTEVENAVKTTMDKFGKIDILVNGAAGNFLASADKLSANGFKTVMEIDALGTFLMSQAVFLHSMKKHGGVIINITALLHQTATLMQVHSSAAKAAVDSIMRNLACEWGPYGVRVVGIAPGMIAGTEGAARLGDLQNVNSKENSNASFGKTKGEAASEKSDLLKEIVPLQRAGSVTDIANAALFLASDAASYVTGAIIVADGGSHLTYSNMTFGFPGFKEAWKAKL